MKYKRKYLYSLLLSLLMICIMHVNSVTVSAAPALSAFADKAGIAQGDEVSVSVRIKNNPQISTLGMALNYDSSILQYNSSSWSEDFAGSDMTMASDTGEAVNLSVVCDDSYSADGIIVTVHFLASQNAESIPVSLVLRDMADVNLTAVSDCSVASAVKVPETAKVQAEESGQAEKDTYRTDTQENAVIEQKVYTTNTDVGNVQNTSVQNATVAASSPGTSSSKADENYKTGAGMGSDMFLLAAVICGVFALALAVKKMKGENE